MKRVIWDQDRVSRATDITSEWKKERIDGVRFLIPQVNGLAMCKDIYRPSHVVMKGLTMMPSRIYISYGSKRVGHD